MVIIMIHCMFNELKNTVSFIKNCFNILGSFVVLVELSPESVMGFLTKKHVTIYIPVHNHTSLCHDGMMAVFH